MPLLPNSGNSPRPADFPIRSQQRNVFRQGGRPDDSIHWVFRIAGRQRKRLNSNIRGDRQYPETSFDLCQNGVHVGDQANSPTTREPGYFDESDVANCKAKVFLPRRGNLRLCLCRYLPIVLGQPDHYVRVQQNQ